jgi:HKD family nuclease
MLDNLELVLLTIDETVRTICHRFCLNAYIFQIDNGQIMELDSNAIVSRVLMRGAEREHQASQSSGSSKVKNLKEQFL